MRQSAYTSVNSCLPCPQDPSSVLESGDECAGGRLQRLDQLAVSVSPPPVCVGGVCVCLCACACERLCELVRVCVRVSVDVCICVCEREITFGLSVCLSVYLSV